MLNSGSLAVGDLLPLRCVNRYTRSFVDRKIFKHVTLQTDTESEGGSRVVPVITETGQRLPVPALTTWSPFESHMKFAMYLDEYTTVLDLENVHDGILEKFLNGRLQLKGLEVLRFKSDGSGFHTYNLLWSFGASTVVVFPSFYPFLGWRKDLSQPFVPLGVTKIVQHVAMAVDFRGPILFLCDPECPVEEEVWVMTHADIDVDFSHFNLWDDRVHDTTDALEEALFERIAVRLKAGIQLTLVGLELDQYLGAGTFNLHGVSSLEELQDGIRGTLLHRRLLSEPDLDNLHFKTWEEYTATLTPEQLEVESLPPGVSRRCIVWAFPDVAVPRAQAFASGRAVQVTSY